MIQYSFIIPVYNVEMYLEQCIQSILQQDVNSSFELILINDGSNDNSSIICDKYVLKDARIKVFHQKNQGVSSARNLGIAVSLGNYICFVDADDILSQEYLRHINEGVSQGYDIIFFGCKTFGKIKGSNIFIPKAYNGRNHQENEFIFEYLRMNDLNFEFFGYTWSKCFKKSIINKYKLRFLLDTKVREDELFTLEFCQYAKSVNVIDKALYNYRITDNGLTHGKKNANEYYKFAEGINKVLPNFYTKGWKNVLIDSMVVHQYMAYCTSGENKVLKKKILDNMIDIGLNNKKEFNPITNKAKIIYYFRYKTFIKSIIEILSKIEKNKY